MHKTFSPLNTGFTLMMVRSSHQRELQRHSSLLRTLLFGWTVCVVIPIFMAVVSSSPPFLYAYIIRFQQVKVNCMASPL